MLFWQLDFLKKRQRATVKYQAQGISAPQSGLLGVARASTCRIRHLISTTHCEESWIVSEVLEFTDSVARHWKPPLTGFLHCSWVPHTRVPSCPKSR